MRSGRPQGAHDLGGEVAIAAKERDDGRLAERPDRVVRIEAAGLKVPLRGSHKVAALERPNRPDAAQLRLEVRLRGDASLGPALDLGDFGVSGQTAFDQEQDQEPDEEEPLLFAGRLVERGAELPACPFPFAGLDGPDARVADEHRDAKAVSEAARERQAIPRDLEGRPRVVDRERPAEIDARPDLVVKEAVSLGEAQAGLEAADPFVFSTNTGQRNPPRHERIGDEVHAVQVLRDLEGAVRGGHRRIEIHLPEHLEAGQLAEQRGVPRVLAEVGELRCGIVDKGQRGVEAETAEHRVAKAPGDPCRAASIAGDPEQLDRARQEPLGLLVDAAGRRGRPGSLEQRRAIDRLRGHVERVAVEAERLLLGAERHGAVPRRPERDPRLRRERVGLRAIGGVPIRGQVVRGERARELLVHERLEVTGRREVARLSVAAGKRGVGDLADERLDERELAALCGTRVDVPHHQLAADQGEEPALHLARVDRGDRREAIHREGVADDRRSLEERAIGRIEGVEPGGDQRVEGLRDRDVRQVADGPVDAVGRLQRALRNEHPHDLDRIQGDPVGPPDDPRGSVRREPGHQAGEERPHRLGRERLEGKAREVALAGAPVRPCLEQLRPRKRDHVDRHPPAPVHEVIDEREQPAVCPLEVLEDHHDRVHGRDPLEIRAPRGEEPILAAGKRLADPEQGEQRSLHPAALLLVRDPARDRLADPGTRRRLVVGLRQPGAHADHLAERPERDPAPIRRRAPVVPVDGLDQAVDVLQELPGEPALADAALAGDRDEPHAAVPRRRVVEVLEQPQLVVSPHERSLDRPRATAPTPLGDHAQGAPGGHGRRLPLEKLVARLLERDRPGGGVHRRLADEDDVGRRDPLQPARRVDHVAGDHALADRPDRHGRLAGHDPDPRADLGSQPAHLADNLQGRAHGPLRVILVAGRRTPDGHDGIADELLDRAAVAPHDPAREVEVAREEVADLLRVAVFGERREAHQVREQHGDDPAFGDRGCRGRRRECRGRRAGEAGAALAAEPGGRRVGRAAGRASRRQRRPTLEAELAPRVVLRAAGGTGHQNHPPWLPEEGRVDHDGNGGVIRSGSSG